MDIYGIETSNKTKEEVEDFQAQYGCKEIVFSYDTDGLNQSSMWEYARTGGVVEDNKVTWPVIAYIDADNRLQYVTKALKSADEVLSNLEQYCGFKAGNEESYTITYVLGGGTNSTENPSYYTPETETIILQDAVWAGHQFEEIGRAHV